MAYNNNYRKGYHTNSSNGVAEDFYNPYAFVGLHNLVWHLNDEELQELSMIQDAPVRDGYSGKIKVDFKALTPFCVKGADGNGVNTDGHYFVPGTSLKGMIRSVFEIMTYSNIRNGIANNRYSMRNLNSPDYELKKNNPQLSGFLVQINGDLFVQECYSMPYRYFDKKDHEDIASFAKFKSGKSSRDLEQAKSVEEKYSVLKTPFLDLEEGAMGMWFFSGFMQNKKHEFLFEIPEFDMTEMIPLQGTEYEDFIFIHEKENENASWKFWKRRLKNYSSVQQIAEDGYRGIVPCFFRINQQGTAVRDLGFSYLYRQPYPKRIHDFLPEQLRGQGIDLAQAVFGYVNGSDALRGRVQVGNAFIECAKPISEQTFVLGGPKPSFFPFYLEQNNPDKMANYFSENTIISGYKRFLLRDQAEEGKKNKSKVTSSFYPLAAGTEFSTVITFHNLHDYELGALLAAITFCRQNDRCYHSLGYAKPFGYGKMQVKSCEMSLERDGLDEGGLIDAFFDKLCKTCQRSKKDWDSDMSYLFLIASGKYNPTKPIRYPKMKDAQSGQTANEFVEINKAKLEMSNFSPKNRQ